MSLKGYDMKNPWSLITLLVVAYLAIEVVVIIFPLLVAKIVALGALGNFTFASFFSATGLITLIMSAAILIGILSIMGVKTGGKR